jgi:hypothetical protein
LENLSKYTSWKAAVAKFGSFIRLSCITNVCIGLEYFILLTVYFGTQMKRRIQVTSLIMMCYQERKILYKNTARMLTITNFMELHFMEPDGSLPYSQGPSTGPYPEPDQSSPYHPILSI